MISYNSLKFEILFPARSITSRFGISFKTDTCFGVKALVLRCNFFRLVMFTMGCRTDSDGTKLSFPLRIALYKLRFSSFGKSFSGSKASGEEKRFCHKLSVFTFTKYWIPSRFLIFLRKK